MLELHVQLHLREHLTLSYDCFALLHDGALHDASMHVCLHTCMQGSLCEEVLHTWSSHYGAEAGAAALKYLPYGGLFLAGI